MQGQLNIKKYYDIIYIKRKTHLMNILKFNRRF